MGYLDFISSHRAFFGFSIALVLILLSAPGPANGQTYEDFKLLTSGAAVGDVFGYSVSVSGDVALIGARGDDDNGSNSGSAYVYRYYHEGYGTWAKEDKLLASDGAADDLFGSSVTVSGDVALIGAPGEFLAGDSGSAYVFRYDGDSGTWTEEAKLLASDGAADDFFGSSVAFSGDVALIGAYWDDDNGSYSGSAYVFRYDGDSGTWSEEAKLLASDGAAADQFGYSVTVSGDVALIGAADDDDNGNSSGSAYVFRYDGGSGTWSEEAKLLASDGAASDRFGIPVAVSGDVALIGAYGDDDNGNSSGSAYVFRYDGGSGTWSEEAKLLASDGAADDYFGQAVAVSGNAALIGAANDDDNGNSSGSAYVFRYDGGSGTWSEDAKFLASDGAASDSFGLAVAVSGDVALIGARGDDDNGSSSGSAYAHRISPDLDIKANGEDGNVILHSGDQLTVTLDIEAKLDAGTPMNIWIYATYVNMDHGRTFSHGHIDNAPSTYMNLNQSGIFSYGYYDAPVWLPGMTNAYLNEGLFNISTTVMDITLTGNHLGLWTFWVLRDHKPNGLPDGVENSDSVTVMVLP